MAEIRDQYFLDVSQALNQIDSLEREAQGSLRNIPVDLDLSHAQQQLSNLDLDIDTGDVKTINREIESIDRNLGEAEKEADDLTGSMKNVAKATKDADRDADRLAGSFAKMKSQLLNIGAGLGAFAALRSVVGFATEAKDAFAILQDATNATTVVFGEASDQVLDFAENVAKTAGLSMSDFNQLAAVLGSALINIGYGAGEAASKTIELTQRAADMASIMGGPVSGALEAIMSALRGEGNPIERFGVTLTQAKTEAEAAALGFKKLNGVFDIEALTAARLNIIMRETERTHGDFANTAEDLANKTKTVTQEFENTKAKVGEALAPIFLELMQMAPAVTEALIDLTPAMSAFATSLAGMIESEPGVLDLVDALNFLADMPRGLGEAFNAVKGISNLAATVGESVFAIFNPFDEENAADDAWAAGMERNAALVQESLERINTQGMINDIREGEEAWSTYASRLAEVGREGSLNPKFIADLGKIAGLPLKDQSTVLKMLRDDAERLGLGADDIAAINAALTQLDGLLNAIDPRASGRRPFSEVAEDAAELTAELPVVANAMDGVRQAAEGAGLSMVDLLAGVNPVAGALLASLTPAEDLALRMEALRSGAVNAGEAFLSTLQPSLIDVQSGLNDLNENGTVSMSEFTTSLQTAATDFLEFMVNIAAIAAISPELAAALKTLGPEAAGHLADGFAKASPAEILAAAAGLLGSPKQLTDTMQGIYQAGLEGLNGADPAAIAAWLGFIEDTFEGDLPGITALMTEAVEPLLQAALDGSEPPDLNPVLSSAISHIRDAELGGELGEKFQGAIGYMSLDATEVGKDLRATFFNGVSTRASGEVETVKTSIMGTMWRALEIRSPSKLMLELGGDAGSAFWSGFEHVPGPTIDGPIVRSPSVGLPTAVGVAAASPSSGGGTTVDGPLVELNVTASGDALSDIPRAAQIAGQVVSMLALVRR